MIQKIYSANILIGITKPFLKNEKTETLFYHNHFTFEIIFNYEETDQFKFDILNLNIAKGTKEADYYKSSLDASLEKNLDYLLYSTIYSNDSYLFLNVQLINLYEKNVIYSKLYSHKIDFSINDNLSEIAINILQTFKNMKLENVKDKHVIKKKKKDSEEKDVESFFFNESVQRSKHEIFFLNGFIKNHPGIISFLEFITGYNFSPFEFFSIEGAFFIGGGYLANSIAFGRIDINKLFLGGYASFNFFLSGFIEPSVGLRFELTYIFKEVLYFTFPIDAGLKINVNNKNSIRFNFSFQFTSYNFNELKWSSNFIIGLMFGYARKI